MINLGLSKMLSPNEKWNSVFSISYQTWSEFWTNPKSEVTHCSEIIELLFIFLVILLPWFCSYFNVFFYFSVLCKQSLTDFHVNV